MPIRPRVLQFGVETAHQRLSDSLIGPQSGAKTAIGHVSGGSQPAWEMDRSCHERSTCERAPRLPWALSSRPQGGIRGGETRDTKPFSDLVFRDSALGYPRPTIKNFRTAYEMLQVERSGAAGRGHDSCCLTRTVADCLDLALSPMQHLWVKSRAAGCRRATEGT